MVIAEPTGLNTIWIGHKGTLWLDIEVFGRQAHGSTPWKGVNAFEKMVELAYKMIHELKPKIELKKSKYDYEDPKGARATINIGGEVKGGVKTNIVPGYYSFSIDRRIILEETVEEAEREIVDFIERVKRSIPELNIKIRVKSKSNAVVTSPNSPLVKTLMQSIREVLNINPKPVLCVGGLDMGYFILKGYQTVTYGPGDPDVAHMADEHICLDDIYNVAKVYLNLIMTTLM